MKKITGPLSRNITGIILLFAILGFSNGCTKTTDEMSDMGSTSGTKGSTTVPGANEVFIQGNEFTPATITITTGTKITWTNKDVTPHTVTSDTKLFDSGSMSNNGTYSFTFTTTGTFQYYCVFHTSMVAKVVVN
jgi:plastocyanin